MMEWFGAAALLPLLVGVAMCLIPMLLALFGLRRVGQMWQSSEASAGGPGRCGGGPHHGVGSAPAADATAHRGGDEAEVTTRTEPTGAHR